MKAISGRVRGISGRVEGNFGTDCAMQHRLKSAISGRMGQVGTDYYHNHANVRAIRGNGKTCPDVSQPVPTTTEAGLC